MIPYDCLADLAKELHTTSPNQSYPTKYSDSKGTDAVSETKDPVSETKDPVSESTNPVSETPKSDWIESVASLSCISSLMCDCQALVDDAKKSDIPNTEQWVAEARDIVEQLQEKCCRFLENTNKFLQDIQTKKAKVNDANPPQVSIEHDPALRGDVRGDNQREY